jgi:hypothetical protein
MTQFKQKPDGGSLRPSQFKKGPQSPDYFGSIVLNLKDMTNISIEDGCHVVKLSGWKKVDKTGKTFLSIAVDRYIPKQTGAPRQENMSQDEEDPF